ncbi:MAG: hypothetical protein ABI343_14905 [Burkholderiaceae bacterium]
MSQHPFPAGSVDWSGDNPGIYLKDSADGPFISLMVWFRIALSPHGKGHAMLLFEDPSRAAALPELANFCISDNEPLARYLVENFCKKFGVFQGAKAFSALPYLPMVSHSASGDNLSSSAISVHAPGLAVELAWDKLGKPFAADVLPAMSATGAHEMVSVFVESAEASITVNGRRLRGNPYPRPFMGRSASSAFLAFSETWLKT